MHNGESYGCLMLGLPKDLQVKVFNTHAVISPDDLADHGYEEDPHITVLYGIHTDNAQVVEDTVNRHQKEPVRFKLTETGVFNNDDYDVVIIKVISDDLHHLNKACRRELEYTETFPDYKPHITIAYVKPGMGEHYRQEVSRALQITDTDFRSNDYIYSDSDETDTPFSVGESLDKEASDDTWIGVDLDGTLATYRSWKGDKHIGNPIPRTVNRVKHWLKDGKDVRIFTARVSGDKNGVARRAIQRFCMKVFGKVLPITNRKDQKCRAIYDDRAVSVTKNSGVVVRGRLPKEASRSFITGYLSRS